jgi:hypothetical protein
MLEWVAEFYETYVLDRVTSLTPPPQDYFYESPGYGHFLEFTEQLAQSASVLAQIPHHDIQRSTINTRLFNG